VGTRIYVFAARYPAHRYLCLRFACRLTTTGARLEARMESLLPSCRALASPTICRFIPALPDTFSLHLFPPTFSLLTPFPSHLFPLTPFPSTFSPSPFPLTFSPLT